MQDKSARPGRAERLDSLKCWTDLVVGAPNTSPAGVVAGQAFAAGPVAEPGHDAANWVVHHAGEGQGVSDSGVHEGLVGFGNGGRVVEPGKVASAELPDAASALRAKAERAIAESAVLAVRAPGEPTDKEPAHICSSLELVSKSLKERASRE